jgi:hypothetical protein
VRKRVLFLIFFSSHAFANEVELVDIKPIYRDYNYQLIGPLIFLIIVGITFLLFKIIRFFIRKKNLKKDVTFDWKTIINSIKKNNYLSIKDVESELYQLLKGFLHFKFGLEVSADLDDELINQVNRDKRFSSHHKVLIGNYISNSLHYRFSSQNESSDQTILNARLEQMKKLITELDSFAEEVK